MELATNTFNKGLQLDTHPMVLGTDVLSDCLNGTLLTMNGNEVVLLNDMGNRRVNNAFLPSGYLPVGMKEYGGIIYVAAYNPITNKSLIGSFPSPLKKIELNDLELQGTIDLKNLEQYTEDSILGIKVLINDSILIPLTGKNSLRAGDKFALYSPNIYRFKNYISNFCNVDPNVKKVQSPKNKRYTLSVGILNSLNEFVDITKTLCRWDENNNIINYDSSYSDIYKFNDNYFISKLFNNENFLETINDSELIKARLKIATNTYAYKLVGPMYIKAQLNHIESFDYNISGVRNDDGTANIWIEGYLTYNCPDGSDSTTSMTVDDLNYVSYGEGTPTFNGFDLIAKQSNDNLEIISPSETSIEKSVYNPITNLYSTKITKKYENISPNNNGIFDYVIGVNANTIEMLPKDNLEGIYLKGLSVKDSLNIEDLGSNKIELSGWKFYNNVNGKYTLLTITLKAFPELGKKFNNLIFKFLNIKETNKVFTLKCDNVYNGKLTLRIDWDNQEMFEENSESKKILNKEVYRVTATYDVINEKTNKIEQESVVLQDITEESLDSTEIITIPGDENNDETLTEEDEETPTETPTESSTESSRWILFTELFNEFYNNLGISDYCTIQKSENNTEYETEFLDKLSITLDTDLALIDTYEEELPVVTGKLIDTLNENDLDYKITHKSIFKFESGNSKIVIPDSDLYPIEITGGENNLEISNIESNISENSQPQTLGTYSEFTEDWYTITKTANEYIYTITYDDHFIGHPSNPIQNIANIFCPLTNILDYVSPKNDYGFCGIGVNVNEIYGAGADYHYLDVITGYNKIIHDLGNVDTDNYLPTNGNRIVSRLVNTLVNYLFNDYSSEIFQLFNEGTNDNLMFTYLVVQWNTYANSLSDADWYSDWYLDHNHAKVQVVRAWWKTSDGGWAQFPNNPLCEKENGNWTSPNISEIIPIPEKYIYCVVNDLSTITDGTLRDTIIGDNVNFYATTDLSECKYNLPYNIYVEFPITYEISDDITLTTPSIGNLKFLVEKPENLTYNYTKTLKSSEAFYEAINTLDTSVVSNIFYDGQHLLTEDDKGNKLDPNVVYESYTENVENVEIVKLKVSSDLRYFVVDRSKLSNDGINLLLYNSKDMGTPKFRYNRVGNDGYSRTCLDFRSSRIVNSKILE